MRCCRSCRPASSLHLHDIFLPDDYPASWGWRGYNEQAGVAALLDGRWEPLFASRYVVTRMSAPRQRRACALSSRCCRARSKPACGSGVARLNRVGYL